MVKKTILFTSFIFHFSLFISAQERATINLSLRNYINENATSTEQLQLLVQGNEIAIQSSVKNLGGNFKYSVRDISAITLSVNKIFQLSEIEGVKRIEGRHGIGNTLDDHTDIHAHITPVKLGQSPLPQGYDGSGVIIGIIDSEIDITHPDFIDASGNTRIKYLWSQLDVSGGTTPSYGYGQEWDAAAIDSGANYIPTTAYFGHGSIVTGIACGNPITQHQYEGVAPKADVIFVAVDMGANFLNSMVDATEYIYTKATLLGKPCVINASVGTYNGSHDGFDLPAQAINNLITQSTGRSFVAAAGNAGAILMHLNYPAETDSAFTWFKYQASLGSVYYEMWANKSQLDNLQFALGADLTNPYTYLGRTNYYNIISNFSFSGGYAQLEDTLKTWAGTTIGTITIQAEMIDTVYHLAFNIKTSNTSYNFRLITKGSGHFDIWSHPSYTGTSNMLKVNLPSAAQFPDIARYRLPTNSQTIVSSFQCSNNVVTVANFNNRNTWVDVNSNPQTTTDTVGARALTSSIGPTRNGIMKPDISASGNNTFGAGLLLLMPTFISNNPQKVGVGGQHILDGGTSMSSPVVAGIISLYLQRYPTTNWKTIKDSLLSTAVTDNFTSTNIPNTKWGFGKVDAFRFLKSSDVIVCAPCPKPTSLYVSNITNHSAKLNWNTQATSTGYLAYIRAVGTSNWTTKVIGSNNGFKVVNNLLPNTNYEWRVRSVCSTTPLCAGYVTTAQTFATSFRLENQNEEIINSDFILSPNPSSREFNITISEFDLNSRIEIFNSIGQNIFIDPIRYTDFIIDCSNWPQGLYYCLLRNGKTILAVRKFVKL